MSIYPTQSEHHNSRTVAPTPTYRPIPSLTSAIQLSTAWMPLDGLIEQWSTFGTEATTSSELQATSMAFCALSHETEALTHYTNAQPFLHTAHRCTTLEYALARLLQAWQSWTEVIHLLENLLLDDRKPEAAHDAICTFITEVMEQRIRLSALIHEVACEQLAAYRRRSEGVQA